MGDEAAEAFGECDFAGGREVLFGEVVEECVAWDEFKGEDGLWSFAGDFGSGEAEGRAGGGADFPEGFVAAPLAMEA